MISNINQELVIRFTVFIGVLVVMLLWELCSPRKILKGNKWGRMRNNLCLLILNTLIVRFVLPLAVVGVAELAVYNGWGILNEYSVNFTASFVISLILLDLLIYFQHLVFHKVPMLWCLHRVHHTDQVIDVTTAVRFHPIEVSLSVLIRISAIIILGIPALAVIAFEVLLIAIAMFNHANVNIPQTIDRWLRWFVVTPDMHRIHHSVIEGEFSSNYGFNLPWWDRLFGTYTDQPEKGHAEMQIGLTEFQGVVTVNVLWLLIQPFLVSAANKA